MQKDIPHQILIYLKKRATDKWLGWDVKQSYKTVVVIPAIKEFKNISKLINTLAQNEKSAIKSTLILFVVNNSEDSPHEIVKDNAKTLKFLEGMKRDDIQLNLEVIDSSSRGKELLRKDAGVGLARKIGMDQALLYFDYSKKGNAIVCLDADCKVDKNYLKEIQKHFDADNKAAVVKYEHNLDNDAIINYEIFLRYYVLGLKYVNSPYAYHSIGSCMVIEPFTYVKIGGMNKKKAGEDFYFLEKAAKVVDVNSIDSTTVYPSSRKSWRVPFGTGQRITRFYEKVKNEYVLYNAQSFIVLKKFLDFYIGDEKMSPEKMLLKAKSISESIHRFLIENNFENSMNRIYDNAKTSPQLYFQKKMWFDSFKTLKLIHYLRDNGYPEQPMFVALNEIFDLVNVENFNKHLPTSLPSPKKQIEYLTLLRQLT